MITSTRNHSSLCGHKHVSFEDADLCTSDDPLELAKKFSYELLNKFVRALVNESDDNPVRREAYDFIFEEKALPNRITFALVCRALNMDQDAIVERIEARMYRPDFTTASLF